MSILRGKNILLGVTGGIAAYKTAFLVRLFIKAGARVKVVMTPAAKEFVSPLTLSTLSKNEVLSSFTHEEDENELWNSHVELGLWADFLLIAPATANSLSKMANGNADNFLLATYLSAKCPVYIAPAMDLDMYKHPTTKNNFEKLSSFGNIIIPAESGELASGLIGEGRMAEPEAILQFMEANIKKNLPLKDKKILITAGPTYEPLDPVRFLGNHSSGKMGYELADAASKLGGEVILISGPTHLQNPDSTIQLIKVQTAQQMFEAAQEHFPNIDIAIAAAAVSDYRPKITSEQKIKKEDENLTLELERTTDILEHLGKIKTKQILVGFALETENEQANALGKLQRKNLDFIVLNSLNNKGAGFRTETNEISIIFKNGTKKDFELKSKKEVATDILTELVSLLHE